MRPLAWILIFSSLAAVQSINVLIFVPGTNNHERRNLNRLAQDIAFRNHGLATFRAVIIPEKKYLVKQKLHGAKEMTLPSGVESPIYSRLRDRGNKFPWKYEYDVEEFKMSSWVAHRNACESVLNSDLIEKLKKDSFDVAIVYAGNPCNLAVVYAMSIPFIYYDLDGFTDETAMAAGVPTWPSLIPSSNSPHSPHMTLQERWFNLWLQAKEYAAYSSVSFLRLLNRRYREMDGPISKMFQDDYEMKKLHPDFPAVSEIKRQAAVYLVNSDPVIEFPGRPTFPNLVYVGGSHIDYPKPLYEDLNQWKAVLFCRNEAYRCLIYPWIKQLTELNDWKRGLEEAPNGAIVFSFGHSVNLTASSENFRASFREAFRSLPNYRVFWKVGSQYEPSDGMPPNVNMSVYLPQADLLAAKETKLLITHGGMDSIMEAVYSGVPILGIPVWGENLHNLRKVEERGMAKILDKNSLTPETVLAAIKEVLGNPKYSQNAKRISRAYKDTPLTPYERLIYWVEYVGRNHGNPHLSPTEAKKLNILQYFNIDMIIFLFLAFNASIWVIRILTTSFLSLIFGGKHCAVMGSSASEQDSVDTNTSTESRVKRTESNSGSSRRRKNRKD